MGSHSFKTGSLSAEEIRTTVCCQQPRRRFECQPLTCFTMQGKAYPAKLGPAPPAVNDARVATVLDLQHHMPKESSKMGKISVIGSFSSLAQPSDALPCH